MRFIYFSLVLSFSLFSCKNEEKNSDNILFHFIVNEFDHENGQMDTTFKIINNSSHAFEGGNWSIHWNQFLWAMDTDPLAKGLKFERISGGDSYLKIDFDSNWNLKANDTIEFNVIQKGIMRRICMGPMGVFLVDNKIQKAFDTKTKVEWENASGIEGLQMPTAAERYDDLKMVYDLEKNDLDWVTPRPKEINLSGKFRDPNKILTINMDENFSSLKSRLNNVLENFLSYRWDSSKSANLIIKENSSLGKEEYSLEILEEKIIISASSYAGLFYSFQSLHQIINVAANENNVWPILKITDSPRFEYRGFLFDISRNFHPAEKIKQIFDYMGYFKLNHFDFRITDDEGWRIEIPGLPELTTVGSNRGYTTDEQDKLFPSYGSGANGLKTGNGYISKVEFIDLLKYANDRNITVIPQISFPSHARAAIKSMRARYNKLSKADKTTDAQKYLLDDINDKSIYVSAQGYNDNIICICQESSYNFFNKVVSEVNSMYGEAKLKMKIFHIAADEVPYGSWTESPICKNFMKENKISSINELYDYNLFRIKKILDENNATMAGWEDVLLSHSKKSQSETEIKKEMMDLNFIPYVWNNTWGGGREDMIYKFANTGFKSIMSNSSAFYFDMANNRDMELYGLNWSGYVDYEDTWSTEPHNVFANKKSLKKHNISEEYLSKVVSLEEDAKENFLGIQSQLWGETLVNQDIVDELFMPNLVVFSQRAWSSSEKWIEIDDEDEQLTAHGRSWNIFSNNLGQRILPITSSLFGGVKYHLPKPGAIIINDTLKVKVEFPGLDVRFTRDGSEPNIDSELYNSPSYVYENDKIVLKVFDKTSRGGKSIKAN